VTDWGAIARAIGAATGRPFAPAQRRPLGGGCINSAATVGDGERTFFVKWNDASRLDMFEAEADGLAALAQTGAIAVPRPICWGECGGTSFLVLERLALGGPTDWAQAGRRLAELHRAGAPSFGWRRDNYIGSSPQPNGSEDDWVAFFRDRRLGFQLALAQAQGHGRTLGGLGERLLADLGALIDHDPVPSLLHGDLWSGNLGGLADGTPAIYDPAVYYGDREADLAMTELFGGFGQPFYAAYREAWPLDPGYPVRRGLYNLYHVLNHLNLFGGSYLAQARDTMGHLIAELR
jgi:fructosamine-3-kinase